MRNWFKKMKAEEDAEGSHESRIKEAIDKQITKLPSSSIEDYKSKVESSDEDEEAGEDEGASEEAVNKGKEPIEFDSTSAESESADSGLPPPTQTGESSRGPHVPPKKITSFEHKGIWFRSKFVSGSWEMVVKHTIIHERLLEAEWYKVPKIIKLLREVNLFKLVSMSKKYCG